MKNIKKALIIGVTGQDGAYLSNYLLNQGYEIYGTARRGASEKFTRLEYLGIKDKVNLVDFDILELSNIQSTINEINPSEIYNLAAQSFVPTSFRLPILTTDINSMGVVRLLDSIVKINKQIKFYQASTSEMFGKVTEIPQNEDTKFYPRSPYGVSKVFSHYITINYRESYNLFACSGILFNHESPLRGHEFVTKKIVKSLAQIKKGRNECLMLGNMEAKRDWGHAEDYVIAMNLMLKAKKPCDYVVSSGSTATVKEFVDKTLKSLDFKYSWEGEGLDCKVINKENGKIIIKVDKRFFRPAEVDILLGDPKKIKDELGWSPKYNLDSLIDEMARFEIDNPNLSF
tara:strand:+ start:20 stop:1051 length:1032 start_codon:yes stop_codon:yes gene_type:complete